ncbi:hypothetical protein ACXEG3_001718 [Klebsiella pneumoniae]|uniref:hypothetical protein n=1 Tax=Enterobacterales TaxID=91347 RepID=UPI000627A063|nr:MULTISPECIES: hypothetical protein [Enterobacterales]ECM3012720.1 hypothetical protein [Salmonella enterica subsp. enterica serovar Virchow]KKJ30778.1 hypothetical protein T653_13410 [Klebsiella pneumoniae MRSN 3852]KMH64761.1 hypothetical protein SM76_04178 [Klebsiella pneumoniae]RRO00620.1 hypothetical protein DMB83_017120 [Pectobacterium aquaticum]SYC76474.1 Uncharacterised protein [Klebsiella pneumoniae]
MEKLNSMERFLILFERFVKKLEESGLSESDIIDKSYLFCVGFYIKYKNDIDKIELANRDVVLSFMLTSYYCFINNVEKRVIDADKIRRMCGLLIHFIMKNKANSETVFITEKRKYDRFLLAMSLRKRDIEYNKSHGHK